MQGSKVTLLSSYTDKSGLFTSEPVGEDEDVDDEGEAPAIIEPHPTSAELLRGRTAVEDEDELLYGDIEALTNKERSVLLCACTCVLSGILLLHGISNQCRMSCVH